MGKKRGRSPPRKPMIPEGLIPMPRPEIERAHCRSCEQPYPIAWMRKQDDGWYVCENCEGQRTGVQLGILQALETCPKCGTTYENLTGSSDPMPCPECSKKCFYCGHLREQMTRIPGTSYFKCS